MKTKVVNEYLTEALFNLLEEKELEEITVTELIKEAGVCRSSFYRNYLTVDDILKMCIEAMFSIIFNEINEKKLNVDDSVYYFFNSIKRAEKKLTILKNRKLLYYIDEPLTNKMYEKLKDFHLSPNAYIANIYSGSSIGLIHCWVNDSFKAPTEYICEIVLNLVHQNRKNLFESNDK